MNAADPGAVVLDNPWSLALQEVAKGLEGDLDKGLSRTQAKRLLEKYGSNVLKAKTRRPAWRILVSQFANLIIGLLAAAGVLSLIFDQTTEAAAIAAAILINALIGFFIELKAARSMESLSKMGGNNAKVVRGGRLRKLAASKLVPGDLIELEAGDVVPADIRLSEVSRLLVDESALSGESLPAGKETAAVASDTPLAERRCMLYRGTAVHAGSAKGLVTATGQATELGRISRLAQEASPTESSPLQKRLSRLGQRLVWATIAVAMILGVAGWLAGRPWLLIIEMAVALAVAAIPEGLPIVATIALARGMWRMAQRHAIITRLSAVETLGSTTIICTDKTGTLTANQMELTNLILAGGDEHREVELNGRLESDQDAGLRLALETGVLCVNAELDDDGTTVGDPLEGALLRAGRGAGIVRQDLLAKRPEEREEAFDPERKMMATFHSTEKGFLVAVKGAPEAVLEVCSRQRGQEGEENLAPDSLEKWQQANQEMASKGLRVIALAQGHADNLDQDPYQDLTLLGLAGLWDPPRQSAAEAVESCHDAGIRVVMITGDQATTARYIGSKMGLAAGDEDVVTGNDLGSPAELDRAGRQRLLNASIFARVSPEQKLDLIKLHQEAGQVVAMTGDGINDAPALNKADIGVAMGLRGTQVAKEAADMVLTDDSLLSIVVAVQQGRAIFANIRKFIIFLLSGNMAEIMAVAVAILAGWPLPLLPLQILYLNMIGDVFPALALGVGRGGPQYLRQAPRSPGEAVLTKAHWWAVMGWGALIAVNVLVCFALAQWVLDLNQSQAVTVSFLCLAFARLWHVFNMRRADESLLSNEVTNNPFIWAALVLCSALLLGAEFVPVLRRILGMDLLPAAGWWLISLGSLAPLVIGQILLNLLNLRQGGEG